MVAAWNSRHPGRKIASTLAWQEKNRAKVLAASARFRAANRDKGRAHAAAREALKACATPSWANDFIIEEAYALAQLRTKVMGFKWHVDHIVPLKSPLVCGLHTHDNLQVIPAAENHKKSNKYWPDMPEKAA